MKFLEKVKNMFTEEVEEEVRPIKTEVRKVEIPVPKPPIKEETIEDIKPEVEIKEEPKPKAPVFFDDKDFDKLPTSSNVEKKEEPKEPPKERPKPVVKPERKEAYGGKSPAFSASIAKEEKKTFKPTPIISPVYGVLDKNYRKDDIAPRKRIIETKPPKELTVDDIRNKAFGTLEDELETSLFGKTAIIPDPIIEEDEVDLFDELDMDEPRHGKIEEPKTLSRAEKNKELELMDEVSDLEQMVINERPEIEAPVMEEPVMEEPVIDNDFDISVKEEPFIEPVEEAYIEPEDDKNMIEDEMDRICSVPDDDINLTESDLLNLIDSMYENREEEE